LFYSSQFSLSLVFAPNFEFTRLAQIFATIGAAQEYPGKSIQSFPGFFNHFFEPNFPPPTQTVSPYGQAFCIRPSSSPRLGKAFPNLLPTFSQPLPHLYIPVLSCTHKTGARTPAGSTQKELIA